jgi:hypothetical protein
MGSQPESKLSRAIMAALRSRGIWCMKIHGGPMTMAGAPDILACVPVMMCFCGNTGCNDHPTYGGSTPVGLFVGFETKTLTGGDPSPIQQLRHKQIRAACGQVFVPRSVADAVSAIVSLGWTPPPTTPLKRLPMN